MLGALIPYKLSTPGALPPWLVNANVNVNNLWSRFSGVVKVLYGYG